MKKIALGIVGLLGIAIPLNAQPVGSPQALQIGMAKSFVVDESKALIDVAVIDFKAVVKSVTGYEGDLIVKYDAGELSTRLDDKKLDIAFLYAHEFAWAQKKYPDLAPLLVAAGKESEKRAHLIIRKDNPAKSFADLRGQKLDLPLHTKEYCRLYLDKLCAGQNQAVAAKFFGSTVKSANQFAALDALARNEAAATVIDTNWLDSYKELKGPVFANNLRVLQQSDLIPASVIVYKKGALGEVALNQVRAGLRKINTTAQGRDLLKHWQIESFEPVPKDYDKSLAAVLKEYPPPEPKR